VIHFTYVQIRAPGFNPALLKLLAAEVNFLTARKIVNFLHEVKLEQEKSDTLWRKLADKYLVEKNGAYDLKENLSDEERNAAMTEINQFLGYELEFDLPRLDPQEISHVKLTGEEYMLLSGMFN
jgi:hypothetical protein